MGKCIDTRITCSGWNIGRTARQDQSAHPDVFLVEAYPPPNSMTIINENLVRRLDFGGSVSRPGYPSSHQGVDKNLIWESIAEANK